MPLAMLTESILKFSAEVFLKAAAEAIGIESGATVPASAADAAMKT